MTSNTSEQPVVAQSVEEIAGPAEAPARARGFRLDRVAWIVIVIAAISFGLHLYNLGEKALHHDESLHATYSWYFANARPLYVHDPLMHGPFQFHAMALVFKLFGDNDFTARVPAAVAGTVLVLTPLLLRRWLGSIGTVTAAIFLTLSPSLLYYSRFAREDLPTAVWTMLMFCAVWRYRDDGRDRWLALLAAGLALGFATKESIYLTAAMLLIYADITLTLAWLDQRGTRGSARLFEAILLAPVAWVIAALWGVLGPVRQQLRLTSIPREGDLLIVVGILTLPQLAAGVQLIAEPLGFDVSGAGERQWRVTTVSLLLGGASIVGLFWDTKRWLLVAAVFYGITIPLFTTGFTNFRGGLTSDLWGALDYWIAQQDVRRGEQPVFYYMMLLPIYEYVTLLIAAFGGVWLMLRRNRLAALLTFWFLGTFAALTWAGEKMPWLLVHMALPLALLAALVVGRAAPRLLALQFRGRLGVFDKGLTAGALAVVAALMVLSVRSAFAVSYGHPDTPVEPLIYTQTSPDIPKLAARITKLVAENPDVSVLIDDSEGASWPWAWYLRDVKTVGYYSPNTLAPQDNTRAVVLVLAGSLAIPEMRARAGEVVPYKHRWWFPEEGYKTYTTRALIQDAVSGTLLRRWWNFTLERVPEDRLGSMNAEALFPKVGLPGVGARPEATPAR